MPRACKRRHRGRAHRAACPRPTQTWPASPAHHSDKRAVLAGTASLTPQKRRRPQADLLRRPCRPGQRQLADQPLACQLHAHRSTAGQPVPGPARPRPGHATPGAATVAPAPWPWPAPAHRTRRHGSAWTAAPWRRASACRSCRTPPCPLPPAPPAPPGRRTSTPWRASATGRGQHGRRRGQRQARRGRSRSARPPPPSAHGRDRATTSRPRHRAAASSTPTRNGSAMRSASCASCGLLVAACSISATIWAKRVSAPMRSTRTSTDAAQVVAAGDHGIAHAPRQAAATRP